MKKKDLILIVIIALMGAGVSLAVSNTIFKTSQHNLEVETVQPITAEFQKPDKQYFNEESFNPTKPITIGENANPDPFKGNQ